MGAECFIFLKLSQVLIENQCSLFYLGKGNGRGRGNSACTDSIIVTLKREWHMACEGMSIEDVYRLFFQC